MLHEVTDSLEAFFKQPGLAPPLRDAAIRFDRPTDPYALDQTTVNLFLFEVREHLELRNNEPVTRRVGGHRSWCRQRGAPTASTWSPPGRSAAPTCPSRSTSCWARCCS
ncbi:DUF4255 domain-containing protein [Mitsuaria sp. TWR114]|uniref:Pvc16 family protein n=1 Tax=Mitsuaria sp. TWR114 TaxID=2601731 RepID=UPI0011BE9D0F|nr:Pvc16 family protein [Mitsuaria sp. TWR114]TXD79119.1 DUF4255 domain-containing protein [Mitsuaria sp. TWR114]